MNVLYKTKMCNYQLNGNCRHGTGCLHAHSPDELRPSPNFQKTKLCRVFQKGMCKDDNCSRAHGEHELRRLDQFYKKKVCKYWKEQGSCIRGPDCYFAHSDAELSGSTPTQTIISYIAEVPPPPPEDNSNNGAAQATKYPVGSNTATFSIPSHPLQCFHPLYSSDQQVQQLLQLHQTAGQSSELTIPKTQCMPIRQTHSKPSVCDIMMTDRHSGKIQKISGSELCDSVPLTEKPLPYPFPQRQLQLQSTARQSQLSSSEKLETFNRFCLPTISTIHNLKHDQTLQDLDELELEKAELLKCRLLRHFTETQQEFRTSSQYPPYALSDLRVSILPSSIPEGGPSAGNCPFIAATATALELLQQQENNSAGVPTQQTELTSRLLENLFAIAKSSGHHYRCCSCGARRSNSSSSLGSNMDKSKLITSDSSDTTVDSSHSPDLHPAIDSTYKTTMNNTTTSFGPEVEKMMASLLDVL